MDSYFFDFDTSDSILPFNGGDYSEVPYFIVASISKRVWLSIALSSSIVGALRIATMVTLDKYSPMGAPDFYVAIFNFVIGFIAGGFASLAVARYFHRRATAYPSNHEIT